MGVIINCLLNGLPAVLEIDRTALESLVSRVRPVNAAGAPRPYRARGSAAQRVLALVTELPGSGFSDLEASASDLNLRQFSNAVLRLLASGRIVNNPVDGVPHYWPR